MSAGLRGTLSAELRAAVRARDRVALSALRSALAAIANAEAVPVDTVPRAGAAEDASVGAGSADAPRRELTEEQVREVVRGEVTEREAAAAEMAGLGRQDEAERLRAEAAVLHAHLRRH